MKLVIHSCVFACLLFVLASTPATVAAQPPPEPPMLAWRPMCIDCPPWFDTLTDRSLVLDQNGQPHVFYGVDHLYHTWYDGSQWRNETADTANGVGQNASAAIDRVGRFHVAYFDTATPCVKYATLDVSGWRTETIETGFYPDDVALAVDAEGQPHIAYATRQKELRYAYRTAADWQRETVDKSDNDVSAIALAVGNDGQPRISYGNNGNGSLAFAVRTNGEWNTRVLNSGSGNLASDTSLVIDSQGFAHLFYSSYSCSIGGCGSGNSKLIYAYEDASGWRFDAPSPGEGIANALVLDAANRPHIVYNQNASAPSLVYALLDVDGAWVREDVSAKSQPSCELLFDNLDQPHFNHTSTTLKTVGCSMQREMQLAGRSKPLVVMLFQFLLWPSMRQAHHT